MFAVHDTKIRQISCKAKEMFTFYHCLTGRTGLRVSVGRVMGVTLDLGLGHPCPHDTWKSYTHK